MDRFLLVLLATLLATGSALGQLPTNSFAVTSACPANAGNPSVLSQVNTDGSLTSVGTVTDGSTQLILNALGYDNNPANQSVLYGMNVVQPLNINNFNDPPNLYQVNINNAQATSLGLVLPPPAPAASFPFIRLRQTLNFVGDGGTNSNYFVGGLTLRYNIFTGLVDQLQLYVGQIILSPFTTATPTWLPLNVSDPATALVVAAYQAQVQTYIAGNFTGPTPQGGIQDWVYDMRTGNLVSYLGQDDKFLTISNPATGPVAVTTTPTTPIPTAQDIGAMFTDRDGNVYAVDADGGTIYKIDRVTGNYSGSSYGAAFQCSRGDAVSLPGALPLPVTLTRFSAVASGRSVRLTWATASEENAQDFLVQRSRRGTDWQTVQTVRAGNLTGGQSYTALDAAPLVGLSYYRLAMRDTDGKTAYSPVEAVKMTSKLTADVYPNPSVSGRLTVELTEATDAGTTLELLNTTGQVVRRVQPTAGQISFPLDAQGLPGGLYYLRVQQAGTFSTIPVALTPNGL
jgi:Secretion system C-terminal sorting domain